MATLRDTISADARSLFASGDVSSIAPGFRFRLDDELLDLSYFEKYPNIAGRRQKGLDHTHWAVARGVGGSTKTSHTAGATMKAAVSALVNSETVIPPIPFAGEGGGAAEAGTVVVTPPSEVDIGAALEGSDTPSASNPFVTESAVGPVGPVQSVNRLLTSPEILALNTTPIQLVAAVPDTAYWPVAIVAIHFLGTVDYTAAGDLGLVNEAGGVRYFETSGQLWGTGDLTLSMFVSLGAALAAAGNKPLLIQALTSDPIDGDGTLDVTVLYRDVDVS